MADELSAARKRIDELARAYQALLQDKEDFKKRLGREQQQVIDVERGKVVQALLEAIDELDMSLAAAEESPLATGVRMIRDSLGKKAAALGVERLSLLGLPFDPNVAEAADLEVTAKPEDDQRVTAELKPAYRLKDRVIRPGKVRVAKYVQPAQA